MALTRKTFAETALILKAQLAAISRVDNAEHRQIARLTVASIGTEFADLFARDNPRFDRERFFRAAGLI